MILSFKDETSSDIYHGYNTKAARRIPRGIWPVAQRKLDMLNAAQDIMDLRMPPGNRLEVLRGKLKEFYSIRINDQFRIIFKFGGCNASEVKITDYHQ